MLGNFLIHLIPLVPINEGSQVTYHKHWAIMIRGITLPLGICLLTIPGWYWVLTGKLFGENSVVIVGIAIITGFALLWLFWRYEDWRNDYYVVTEDRIIDVKRLPLGFNTNTREASLGSVQNLSMRIPNMIAASFGYGDVEIDTAGREGQLVFQSVGNPKEVLADVSARIDEFKNRQGSKERDRRDQEMLDWFTAYTELERVKIVRNPPILVSAEPINVEWRVEGKPAKVETRLYWDLVSRPQRNYTNETPLQVGGIGNYQTSFRPPQSANVFFAAVASIDGTDYWSIEQEIPVSMASVRN